MLIEIISRVLIVQTIFEVSADGSYFIKPFNIDIFSNICSKEIILLALDHTEIIATFPYCSTRCLILSIASNRYIAFPVPWINIVLLDVVTILRRKSEQCDE